MYLYLKCLFATVCCCSLGRLLTGCGVVVVVAVRGVVSHITCCYSQFLIRVNSDNNEGMSSLLACNYWRFHHYSVRLLSVHFCLLPSWALLPSLLATHPLHTPLPPITPQLPTTRRRFPPSHSHTSTEALMSTADTLPRLKLRMRLELSKVIFVATKYNGHSYVNVNKHNYKLFFRRVQS